MRQKVKLTGFILVAIGLLGLILEDFVLQWGSIGPLDITLIFGAVDAIGLAALALAYWGYEVARINPHRTAYRK